VMTAVLVQLERQNGCPRIRERARFLRQPGLQDHQPEPCNKVAQEIAKRSGPGKARVALARKLSMILHSIWRSGEPFRWSEQEPAQAA